MLIAVKSNICPYNYSDIIHILFCPLPSLFLSSFNFQNSSAMFELSQDFV